MIINFDRIGRNHNVDPLTVDDSAAPDAVAEAVWGYARRFLTSHDFDVAVDLSSGVISIEWGRFGRGVIVK